MRQSQPKAHENPKLISLDGWCAAEISSTIACWTSGVTLWSTMAAVDHTPAAKMCFMLHFSNSRACADVCTFEEYIANASPLVPIPLFTPDGAIF
uniref:Uncharacterized protein n=1 Tax=Romanomermis culicivorax TaxID=13658 RepID=A0A915JCR8_ROMCU